MSAGAWYPARNYSDSGALIFAELEAAMQLADLSLAALRELDEELERVLPSPQEAAIEAAFAVTLGRLGLGAKAEEWTAGKRVALRMLVTIARALSQPAVRDSGVMRLPQTIPGLFAPIPRKRTPSRPESPVGVATEAESVGSKQSD